MNPRSRPCVYPSFFIFAGLVFGFAAVARAELPKLAADETVIVSDDFTDNKNVWSNIVATDLSSPGVMNKARIANSLWSPSQPGGESIKSTVESVLRLETPVDLSSGPVSLYVRARVDDPRGGDGNRFSLTLHESKRTSFVNLNVRPGVNTYIEYRNDLGKTSTARLPSVRFEETRFVQLKLTIKAEWNVDGFIGHAEAFVYDDYLRRYESIGAADESVTFKTGRLDQVSISSRNGATGFVYLDSIVVTQTKR